MKSVWLAALLVAGLPLLGCGDLFMSKEQRQEVARIRETVSADPSRLDAPFEGGEPPLHLAIIDTYASLLDWLLDRGADPNGRDQKGWTALHEAVIYDGGDGLPAMRTLLRRGAQVDGRLDDGQTPLHIAAFSSRAAAMALLLASGADPNARTVRGEAPLHLAATPQPTVTAERVRQTIHLLAEGGADLNARESTGATPLHRAAMQGNVAAIEALLAEGADTDLPDAGGRTPLHVAAVFGRAPAAEALLKAGADVNRRDNEGRTPLRLAFDSPATSFSATGSGPVDTSSVVEVLRRSGGADSVSAPRHSEHPKTSGARPF